MEFNFYDWLRDGIKKSSLQGTEFESSDDDRNETPNDERRDE